MIEQLQSLMKALEAGSYSTRQDQHSLYIDDGTGEQPIKSSSARTNSNISHCDHQWTDRDGFMLGYKYCELCRETVK